MSASLGARMNREKKEINIWRFWVYISRMWGQNLWADWPLILCGCRYTRRYHLFQIWWRSVQGCSVSWWSNFAIRHWLWWSSLQHSNTTVWAYDENLTFSDQNSSLLFSYQWATSALTLTLKQSVPLLPLLSTTKGTTVTLCPLENWQLENEGSLAPTLNIRLGIQLKFTKVAKSWNFAKKMLILHAHHDSCTVRPNCGLRLLLCPIWWYCFFFCLSECQCAA